MQEVIEDVEDNERALSCLRKELDALTNTVGKTEDIAIANAGRIVSVAERHNKLDEKVQKIVKHINGYDNRDNATIKRIFNNIEDIQESLDEHEGEIEELTDDIERLDDNIDMVLIEKTFNQLVNAKSVLKEYKDLAKELEQPVNSYNKIIKNIYDRLEGLEKAVMSCSERELKKEQGLHAKYMAETRDRVESLGIRYNKMLFDVEVNKCLINRRCLLGSERELVESEVKRKLNPEWFEDEDY